MLLLGLDTETTGLDFIESRPIEVGMILYSTGQQKCLESTGFLVKSDKPISAEIAKLTGITQSAVDKFGYDSKESLEVVLDMMAQADAVVGQNIIRFDKRMLEAWGSRHGLTIPEKLYIDTLTDLPGVEGKHLGYQAADHGFLNLFPHSALSDVQTCIKLVSMYDIDKVVERAKSPLVILKAHVTFDTNKLAKARKYRWFAESKLWWKAVKQMDVPAETAHQEFDISFINDIPLEKLQYS